MQTNPIYLPAIVFAGLLASATFAPAAQTKADQPPPPAPTPGQVVMAINCGGEPYTGSTFTSYSNGPGTQFISDGYFTGGTPMTVDQKLLGLGADGNDPMLYQNFRSGPSQYKIPLPKGKYIVILAYCETTPDSVVGSRVFNVSIQGTPVLKNFDILTKTRLFMPIYETFSATVAKDTLTIEQTKGPAGDPTISTIIVRTPPTPPTKIILGEYTNYALVDGLLLAGGSNRIQEAGFPQSTNDPIFPMRPFWKSDVRFVDGGCSGYQSYGVDTKGHVWAWGGNVFGQMGNGVADKNVYPPTQIATDSTGKEFTDVKQIAAGFEFAAALKKDGTVWVWGLSGNDGSSNDCSGVIGNGDKTSQNVTKPSKVIFPKGVSIAKISASVNQILALDTTGAVWSWGGGGVIENRGTNNADPATPTKLAGVLSGLKITEIACGNGMNYVVDSKKNLYGWGQHGILLGLGSAEDSWHPTPLPIPINFFTAGDLNGHVVDVKTSSASTHVLRDDGTLWGWGSSPRGEVGNGVMADWTKTKVPYAFDYGQNENMVMQPVQVLDHVAKFYSNPQSGAIFAVKKDGTIWSWGWDKTSYLGNGTTGAGVDVSTHPDTLDVAEPAQVAPY